MSTLLLHNIPGQWPFFNAFAADLLLQMLFAEKNGEKIPLCPHVSVCLNSYFKDARTLIIEYNNQFTRIKFQLVHWKNWQRHVIHDNHIWLSANISQGQVSQWSQMLAATSATHIYLPFNVRSTLNDEAAFIDENGKGTEKTCRFFLPPIKTVCHTMRGCSFTT